MIRSTLQKKNPIARRLPISPLAPRFIPKTKLRPAALALSLLAALSAPAWATDWIGGPTGSWTNPNNWNPTGIPGSGSFVTVDAGSVNTSIDISTATINSTFVDLKGSAGGIVTLNGDLSSTTSTQFLFENGSTFTGNLSLLHGQNLAFIAPDLTLDNRTLALDGTVIQEVPEAAGEALTIGTNTTTTITGDGAHINSGGSGDQVILKGQVNINTNAVATVDLQADNLGTIEVINAGSGLFTYGGANQGTIKIDSATTPLYLDGVATSRDSNGTFQLADPEIHVTDYTLGSNGFAAFQVQGGAVKPQIYVDGNLNLGGKTINLDASTILQLAGGINESLPDDGTNISIASLSNGTLNVTADARIKVNELPGPNKIFGLTGFQGTNTFHNLNIAGDLRIDASGPLTFTGTSKLTGTVAPGGGNTVYLLENQTQDNVTFTNITLDLTYLDTDPIIPFASDTNHQLTLGSHALFTATSGNSATLFCGVGGTVTNQGTITAPSGATVIISWDAQVDGYANSVFDNQGQINVAGNLTLNNELLVTKQTAGNIHLLGGTLAALPITGLPTTPFYLDGGSLTGNGTVNADVISTALISPGNSVGHIDFSQDLTLQSGSEVDIQIAALGNLDTMTIAGTLTLGGTLDVSLLSGFTPAPTDTFTPLTANSLTGAFTNATFLTADGNFSYNAAIVGNSLILSNFQPVPEPTTLALLSLSALLLTRRRHAV